MTETITVAGATPVVAGAMPAQNPPAVPVAAPPTTDASATDYPEGLGDAGKQALDRMKAAARDAESRAKKAEKALADIQTASQSESEKAIAAARLEGATEATAKADARVRRAEVRAALTAAGCSAVDIVAKADEFAALEVDDEGNVLGLDKAVTAVKAANAALFGARRPTGSADAGSTTSAGAPQTTFSRSQLRDPVFYQANKAAIQAAQAAGRITG